MARPPKNPEQRMADQLRIPLTATQKRLIAAAAEVDLLEMTAWARRVLIQAAQKKMRCETGQDSGEEEKHGAIP
jgi:uncharacterized protein (DUF1778 family)